MTGCTKRTVIEYRPLPIYMSPEVTKYFRANPLPEAPRNYLKEITAQQCAIDEVYWNTKCVKVRKK